MKKVLLTVLTIIIFSSCSNNVMPTATPEPVLEEVFEQITDDGKVYTSKDFFDAGFKEYKEYNVAKLIGATEAWYGYWGKNMDDFQTVNYYELRFYPDHSTAVSDGTLFAEDATGKDANLGRQDAIWKIGLADRKRNRPSSGINLGREWRLSKYAEYMIYDNVIILCMGEDSRESFKLCNDLIYLVNE